MAERIGIDYESNPAGFISATKQVMSTSAEALKGFDLTDRSLKRLAVSYLSTADTAKQSGIVQQMVARQIVADAAASAAAVTAGQREVQAATRETVAVQERSAQRGSVAAQLISSAFQAHNLRSFRGDLKEAAAGAEESRGSFGALSKTIGVLGGSLVITAAAAPLINHAFSVIQKPAEMLDKALFGDTQRAKELAKQAQATGDALLKAFGTEATAGSLKSTTDLGTRTKLLAASVSDLKSQADAQAASLSHLTAGTGLTSAATARLSATYKTAAADAEHNRIQTEQMERHLASLAAQMGDTGAKADGYAKELAIVNSQGADIINAGPAMISELAAIGNQASITADSTYGLVSAVSSLLNILGQAGHGSITAGFSTIVGDVVKDAGILANNPLLTQTQASLQKKGLNPDQISAFLAQQKTTLSAIGSGGVSSVGGQAGLYDLNNIINPKKGGGGGGGGGGSTPLTAAQTHALTFADQLSNLKKRIADEAQIHPTSLAYAKQLEHAEKATIDLAHKDEKHAQALYTAAKGAKAKHSALKVLHQAQHEVSAATKNLTHTLAEAKTIALAHAKAALELKDAQLEASVNMLDQATADAVHIKEAKEQLDTDKVGTLAYYKDLKTYNEAVATAATDAASAAQQAKDAQLALTNSIVEAGINYSDPLSGLRAAVTEAQNTLANDTPGTTSYNLDTAALNRAQNALANALTQNTTATVANTTAMNPSLNDLPGYATLRAGANSEAYLGGSSRGGAQPVVINNYISTNDPDVIAQALNERLSRSGSSVRL